MKVLVTGSAGFIGFHLVGKLLREGHEVVGLDNINDYYDTGLKFGRLREHGIEKERVRAGRITPSSTQERYRFIQLPLEARDELMMLFAKERFDVVCNMAAQAGVRYSLENPFAYVDSNIVGFVNLLEGCRQQKVNHFVFASSSSVYGLNTKMPFSTSDHTDHPVSLYAATKKSNEMMAHTYAHLYGIPTTGLRFFTVYGPWGRPDMAPFLFTKAAFEGTTIKVFNHGDMLRDFTYIDDIVEGVYRVCLHPPKPDPSWDASNPTPERSSAPYRIYNIGNSTTVKLGDFIAAVEKATGIEIRKEYLPIQPGDVQATYADVSGLMNDFGYRPDTPLQTGIDRFVTWYRDFYRP